MVVVPAVAQESLGVGNFSAGDLSGWQEKSFQGKTQYQLTETEVGTVLQADSQASASGLFRELEVDLQSTPCLNWTWKVDAVLDGLDETTKGGDDYPARVYVVFSTGPFFWNTRALNYVWSSGQPPGSGWANAFTEKSVNVAAQSGTDKAGQWVTKSRNVWADYRRFIGTKVAQVEAVAVMTDTDNSGRSARAYYGDIRFDASC